MSDDLSTREAELRTQLDEITRERSRRVETERLAALTKPVEIEVHDFAGAMVIVRAPYRDDLLAVWKSIPGRAFRGQNENAIPLSEWERNVKTRLLELPNVTIKYRDGVSAAIMRHLNAPTWEIEIAHKRFKVTPGPRCNAIAIKDIPGLEWQGRNDPSKAYYTAPLAEAWRLYTLLANTTGVMYSDEAREFTLKQIEMRGKLDEIGKAGTMEYDANFVNGFTLRPFQGVGVNFLEAAGGRALLAYQMGLGKTPMSLAYAWKNQFRTIVVCPASLKANWCRQIDKFTGQKPSVLTGTTPDKHDLISLLTSKSLFSVINYDILGAIAKYDSETVDEEGYKHIEHMQRFLWVELINLANPDLVIFDESHYIKNSDSNRSQAARAIKCDRIVHMTGTPVLNRPGELWPILTMLAPDTFPSEEAFIQQYTIDGKRARNVDKLQESLRSIMIRRKHSDVKADLPPIDRIIEYHELSPKAKKLYDKVLMGVYEKISAYDAHGRSGGEQGIANILVQIQRLKQVCAIDKLDDTADLAREIYDSNEGETHRKVLIFSQFKAVTFAISQRLGDEAISFVSRGKNDFVTANDLVRDSLVQQFQTDPSVHFLCVTEKTAKEGHDITQAGTVIFNDLFWTPANHEQGEGRAYMRESDPHGITAYYMITDKSNGADIEEYIWQLLKMKTSMIEATVEGVEGSRDTSIAMDLIAKIKEGMWRRA